MRVRFHIEFELSPRQKRLIVGGIAATVLLGGTIVWASVPNVFKDGDPLSAQTMNDNFTALDQRLSKVETVTAKASADAGYAFGASYCGSSGVTKADLSGVSGTGTGYVKARAQCQTTCSSPGAHLCTSDEVSRSAQLGVTVPNGWYSSVSYFASSAPGNECSGFTDGTSTTWQASWWVGGTPSADYCNQSHALLCCD